jgi:hypothetical protein
MWSLPPEAWRGILSVLGGHPHAMLRQFLANNGDMNICGKNLSYWLNADRLGGAIDPPLSDSEIHKILVIVETHLLHRSLMTTGSGYF